MPKKPKEKRTIAFIDGQNLFYAAKESFGYSYPNYDPKKLAEVVCEQQGWTLTETRFYTGVPASSEKPQWHEFWANKLRSMSRNGVQVYSRELTYKPVPGSPGKVIGDEKGIDIRIALDVMRKTYGNDLDVALIFSQDQDFSELADEMRVLARREKRWIKIASAFPYSAATRNRRGINGSDWIKVDADMYSACIDPWDYRKSTR